MPGRVLLPATPSTAGGRLLLDSPDDVGTSLTVELPLYRTDAARRRSPARRRARVVIVAGRVSSLPSR
jgi:hypothetical protein